MLPCLGEARPGNAANLGAGSPPYVRISHLCIPGRRGYNVVCILYIFSVDVKQWIFLFTQGDRGVRVVCISLSIYCKKYSWLVLREVQSIHYCLSCPSLYKFVGKSAIT